MKTSSQGDARQSSNTSSSRPRLGCAARAGWAAALRRRRRAGCARAALRAGRAYRRCVARPTLGSFMAVGRWPLRPIIVPTCYGPLVITLPRENLPATCMEPVCHSSQSHEPSFRRKQWHSIARRALGIRELVKVVAQPRNRLMLGPSPSHHLYLMGNNMLMYGKL